MNGSKLKQWFMEWWLLLMPATFALGAITTYAIVFRAMPATENPAAWGTFGDFIGGLMNPLVSVLTLFVAISVWRLQKAELKLTRSEMAQTKEAMEDQAKTAEQQRREQRFLDFLNLYQITLQSISFEEHMGITAGRLLNQEPTPPPRTRNGKQAFQFLTSSWTSPIRSVHNIFLANSDPNSSELSPAAIKKAWDANSPLLDHYFRTVFTVLREAAPILKNDQYRFIKLFRAQLSRDEINLIALNLLYDPEGAKMRPLVAMYGMLKHMPPCALRAIAERELDARSFGNKWANITIQH